MNTKSIVMKGVDMEQIDMEEARMIDEGNPNFHGEDDTDHARILNRDDYEYLKDEKNPREKFAKRISVNNVHYDVWIYFKHEREDADFYKIYRQPDGRCINSGDPFYDREPSSECVKRYVKNYDK